MTYDNDTEPKCGSYLSILTHDKCLNVKCDHLLVSNNSFKLPWSKVLRTISDLYPGKISVPYICFASFDLICANLQ